MNPWVSCLTLLDLSFPIYETEMAIITSFFLFFIHIQGHFLHCFLREKKGKRHSETKTEKQTERKKHWHERETSFSWLLVCSPTRDQTHNLGMCPDQELNPWSFVQYSITNWATSPKAVIHSLKGCCEVKWGNICKVLRIQSITWKYLLNVILEELTCNEEFYVRASPLSVLQINYDYAWPEDWKGGP